MWERRKETVDKKNEQMTFERSRTSPLEKVKCNERNKQTSVAFQLTAGEIVEASQVDKLAKRTLR